MAGYQRFATSYGVYKVKKIGTTWWVLTPDGSKFPYESRAAALASWDLAHLRLARIITTPSNSSLSIPSSISAPTPLAPTF